MYLGQHTGQFPWYKLCDILKHTMRNISEGCTRNTMSQKVMYA